MFILCTVSFALAKCLTIQQVKLFCNDEFSQHQVNHIFHGLANDKLSIQQVSLYADPILTHQQMNDIRLMLRMGMPTDQVMQKVAIIKLQK